MKDEHETKKQLINELVEMRQRTEREQTQEVQDKEPCCLRILAIDDYPTALDFYQEVLCPTGNLQGSESTTGDLEAQLLGNRSPKAVAPSFDVILCRQGDEAVEIVRGAIGENKPFAVVFLDVRLPPGPDGVWTAEHIRALDPYVQIVMVTAYSDVDPTDISCRVPPMKRLFYVHKPFDPQELRQFAFALGAKWHAERQVRKMYEELEDRVEQRTAELRTANEQLQQEITERERAEEALRESEERFRSITASAQDGIIMTDNEGNISYWNEAAKRIFGYTKEEAIGKEVHTFLGSETYHEAYRKGFRRFKETGQGPVVGKTLELSAIRKDGTEFPIELSVSVVKVKGKWNSIGIVRDITERRRAEEALERQDKERIKFINALIHEIKTPLTAMLASSELLREELSADSSPLSSLAENLSITTHNLNRRISELTEFARVQSAGFVLGLQSVDIHQLAQHIAAQVNVLLQNKGQSLDLQLPTSLPRIEADPERVTQIFLNLLTNASKFSPPHSQIYLRAYPANTQLVLEVRDSAPRIGPEEAKLIFNPYYLGKKAGGCGLGLSVCKRLVEIQGGKIWVETQVTGNSFKFSLPLAENSRFRSEDGT